VSKSVDEIVTDDVDWVMQAPFRARFSDLYAVDMKEILQQRMFKNKSYEAHKYHKNLFDALEKSLEHDYSNQLLSDLEATRQNSRWRNVTNRLPIRSTGKIREPPPSPPPAGASGAPSTSGASGSSKLPSPPTPLSTASSGSAQQQGSKAPTSCKSVATTPHSMAWTISDTRYDSTGVFASQESSLIDSMINDDSIPNE
nr:hypothetical protein [Tanacetum cinerariifolium]